MKKSLKMLVALLLVCAIIISGVQAADVLLSYTTVTQEKSMWCWAASAENSVRYFYSFPNPHREAVRNIKGSSSIPYPDVPGDPSETALAAEYCCNYSKNYTYTPCSLTNGVKSFAFLAQRVDQGYPPILMGGYYNGSVRTGGHWVTLVGYYSSGVTKNLRYKDPVNNSLKCCSYAAFKDGSYNGRKYDATAWKS